MPKSLEQHKKLSRYSNFKFPNFEDCLEVR